MVSGIRCCLLYYKDEIHFSIRRAQTLVFLWFVITLFNPSTRMCLQVLIFFTINVLYIQRNSSKYCAIVMLLSMLER
jgi:hypothetical protein